MKKRKFIQIVVIAIMCALATACQPKEEKKQESSLPVYQPGSIELVSQENDYYNFERKYRHIYYTIYGAFDSLLTEEELKDYDEWFDKKAKEEGYGEFQEEMFLVSRIKRHNSAQEECDLWVEELKKSNESWRLDMTHEENELPNADIIYTFDNDIINEYYRYA